MSIAFVSGAGSCPAGTNTSVVITAPTSIVSGNLLITILTSVGAPTTLSGWSLVANTSSQSGGGYPDTWVYSKTATGSEPGSYTWVVPSQARPSGVCLQYSGAAVDGTPAFTFGAFPQTTYSTASVTPTTSSDTWLVYCADTGGNRTAASTPSGFTARTSVNPGSGVTCSLYTFDQALTSSAATGAATGTWSGNAAYSTVAILLKTPPLTPPVSGYTAWYDATQVTGTSDGTLVTSWADSSGNGNNLTAHTGTPTYYSTTSAKLINGHPTVFFNQDGHLAMGSNLTVAQPITVFVVAKKTGTLPTSQYTMYGTGTLGYFTMFSSGASPSKWAILGATELDDGNSDNNAHYFTGQFNGASSLIRVDGVAAVSGSAGSTGIAGVPFVVGDEATSATGPWQGPIGELIIYPSALSLANMQAVEAYLQAKWGFPPVSGYVAWYDATQITGVSDGATLTNWPDSSSSGNPLSTHVGTPVYYSTTPTHLLNNLPVVYFNANGLMYTGSFTVNQPLTIFTVTKMGNATSGIAFVYGNNNDNLTFGVHVGQFIMYAGSANMNCATADNNEHVFTNQFNGSSSLCRIDGTQVATGNPGTSPISSVFSIASENASSQQWIGPIGEIMIYPSALTTLQMQSVEAYLTNKWIPTGPAGLPPPGAIIVSQAVKAPSRF